MTEYVCINNEEVVANNEEYAVGAFVCIVLLVTLLIILSIMDINVYELVFKGVDVINVAFRNFSDFASKLTSHLRFEELSKQLLQLF